LIKVLSNAGFDKKEQDESGQQSEPTINGI
jgi:hypothetical protein